jgi:hypothetical protein
MLLHVVAVPVVTLLAAACGQASTGAAHITTTPTLAVCTYVDDLHTTLAALTPVKGSSLPTSAQMKAAAQDIQSSVSGLSGRGEWQAQIDSLASAGTNLKTAADNLAASPGNAGVTSDARTAVAGANDAIRRLITAAGSRCTATSP